MSNKVKLKNIIVSVLRDRKMTKVAATDAADEVLNAISTQLTEIDGQVVIGKLGRLYCKKYDAGTYFNPGKRTNMARPAYKTVRFKPFTAARKNL